MLSQSKLFSNSKKKRINSFDPFQVNEDFSDFIKLKLLSIKIKTKCQDNGTFRGVGKMTSDIFHQRKHFFGRAPGSREWQYSHSGGHQSWDLILFLLGSHPVALDNYFTHSFVNLGWQLLVWPIFNKEWQSQYQRSCCNSTKKAPALVTLLYSL